MSVHTYARIPLTQLAIAISITLLAAVPLFAAESADPTTLDTIQVRAPAFDAIKAEQRLTPGGVTVVDGETFYERTVNNMSDALRYVPGVWTESSAGGDAIFISSRGSNLDATSYDSNGVKLFQDGLPITTADGNNHNRFMDPMAARSLVFARGANALAYGASNLGGAVDFATPNARDSPTMQVFLSGGSDGLFNVRLTAGGVSGDLDAQLTLETRQFDGYREHGQQDRAGLYANAGWQVTDDFNLRAYATYVDNQEQLAGPLTRTAFNANPYQAQSSAITGNFQLNVRTTRLAAKGRWEIDANSGLEFGLSYEDQHLYHPIVDKILVDFDGPGPLQPVEVFSLLRDADQRTVAGMVRYNLVLGDHDVLAGLNIADTHEQGGNYRNDGGRRNGLSALTDKRSDSVEVFLVDRWKFAPDWILVYGAQGVVTGRDVRTTDAGSGSVFNPKADYSAFNPRVGVIHALNPASELFASVSRLYEAPTAFELEDDASGNGSTLDAMHGKVIELGLRSATAGTADETRWRWDVSAYYARLSDEILSIDDPAAPGTSLSANVDRTLHAGIEALLGASFPFGNGAHRIEPLVSASYNAFYFDGDSLYGDNDLPAAPDYLVRGEVLYRHASGFFAGPTLDVVGSRYADFSNSYRVDSYRLLGLRAGIDRQPWSVFGEVRNLLDKEYVGVLTVKDRAGADDALLQAGAPRSVYVGVRYRF